MDFRRRLEAERHEKEKKVLIAQKEHWGDAAVGVYSHDRNSAFVFCCFSLFHLTKSSS